MDLEWREGSIGQFWQHCNECPDRHPAASLPRLSAVRGGQGSTSVRRGPCTRRGLMCQAQLHRVDGRSLSLLQHTHKKRFQPIWLCQGSAAAGEVLGTSVPASGVLSAGGSAAAGGFSTTAGGSSAAGGSSTAVGGSSVTGRSSFAGGSSTIGGFSTAAGGSSAASPQGG